MKLSHIALALYAMTAASFVVSCTPTDNDPLACKDDGSCAHQSELSWCDIDGVYPASALPNECIAPPSADACNRIEACTDPAKPLCTDDSMGTCVECISTTDCTGEQTCDTRTGTCTDEPIFTCTPGATGDADCVAEGAGLDYCGAGDICVACLEDTHCVDNAAGAVCDQTLFECRGCEENSECDSRLCGTETAGVCVDDANVVYVDVAGGTDGGGCGVVASPCASIGAGLAKVTATRNIVLVAAGTYDEQLSITDTNVTLLAEGVVISKAALGAEGENVIKVTGNSDVALIGFTVEPAASVAKTDLISCIGSGASLSIAQSTVHNSLGLGIVSSSCTLNLERSTVSGNTGGIRINAANYTIRNNFITDNVSTVAVGGVVIEGTVGKTEIFEFNTLSHNANGGNKGFDLACNVTNLTAKNNIFMLNPTAVAGVVDDCNTDYSLIDTRSDANAGTHTNTLTGAATFLNLTIGDYHLATGSAGIDAADPAATLAIDIDGDARPLGAGRDMGADEA